MRKAPHRLNSKLTLKRGYTRSTKTVPPRALLVPGRIREIHTGEKPHHCERRRRFSQSGITENHLRAHTHTHCGKIQLLPDVPEELQLVGGVTRHKSSSQSKYQDVYTHCSIHKVQHAKIVSFFQIYYSTV